jgi:RecA-family ATPase
MTIATALEGAKPVAKKAPSKKPVYRCTEITADELLNKKFKEPRWAVKDLIPEGSTIICGKPKSGKSIAALNLAVGITSGNNRVFGNMKVESGGVLYLALEDTERRLKERLEKMLADGGVGSKELHLVTEWPHMGVGGLEKLEEKIKSVPNLRLVIIDTLGRFKPPRPGNTNIYDFDYSVTSQITAVAHRHNISIVIIHHLRKLESDDRFDDVSSSYGITGGVDTVVVLLSGGIKADSLMMIRGRDVEEETYVMKFHPQYLSWNIKGREDEIMTTDNFQKVFNAIAKAGKPLGPKQISQISGIDYDYTRRLVQLMVKNGALIKEGRGRYKIKTLFDR